MQYFSLDFARKDPSYYYLFPIPTSNSYQFIKKLQLPQSSNVIDLDRNNQVLITEASPGFKLSFQHEARAIKTNWSSVELKKNENIGLFTKDQYINYFDQDIKNLADDWKDGEKDLKKIVFLLYAKTLDYLTYGKPIKGLHPYSQALKERITDCGGFATFLATLLQGQGLLTHLAVGYVLKNNFLQKVKKEFALRHNWTDLAMHAWLEIQTADGQWLPLDPATDWRFRHGLSKRFVSFVDLPADRLLISYGHNHYLEYFNKSYSWPILQHPQLIKASDV